MDFRSAYRQRPGKGRGDKWGQGVATGPKIFAGNFSRRHVPDIAWVIRGFAPTVGILRNPAMLLIPPQVNRSLQLSVAVVPLVVVSADRVKMGALVAQHWRIGLAIRIAAVIIALNVKLILDFAGIALV